jgi:TPR repeat protein
MNTGANPNISKPARDNSTPLPAPTARAIWQNGLGVVLAFLVLFLGLIFLPPIWTNLRLLATFAGVGGGLLLWLAILWMRAGRGAGHFQLEYLAVKSHYVQAAVHLSIYAYWGWYWRKVYEEAPLILAQILFLYVFDALLTWSRGRSWRLGFGPLPIVLSTNFFLWFKDDWFFFQFLMVATGALGKQFVLWQRDGRKTHIFNPSSFGLAIFSLVLLATGTSHYTWGQELATTLGMPYYIYAEIFFLGLIVQALFGVTLMTLAATAALCLLNLAYTARTGVYFFVDSNIPIAVFLGLHLLVTDPATSPRTNLGKAIFGALYGLGVWVSYAFLRDFGLPTFYDKLLVVPFLNLSVRCINRCAGLGVLGRFNRWETIFGLRKLNFMHMACWALLFAAMLGTGFVEGPQPGESIAFWKKAAEDGKPHAAENLMTMLQHLGADNRMGEACNELGLIYAEGKLTKKNPAAAIHYFARACDCGYEEGCENAGVLILMYNAPDSAADAARVLDHLEMESVRGSNGLSCYLVGCAYESGHGRALDKTKARAFYARGAALGVLGACKNLARMEINGEGGPVDHAEAARWLERAAEGKDADSCMKLGLMYHNGDGVAQDEQRAIALLEKACGLGATEACQTLQRIRR